MRASERAVLVGIVMLVALALRAAFVGTAVVQNPLRADAGEYAQCAANLVEHGVYSTSAAVPPPPDSFRSPGYPLVLAACRLLAGSHWQGFVLWLQVALGTMTVLTTYLLARSWLGFGPSLAAAALVALSPHLVVAGAYVLTETVTAAFVVGGLALWCRAERGAWWRLGLGAGALGAAALCNETLVVLPVVAAFALRRHLGMRVALCAVALALLPTALWSVRNATTELARTGGQRAVASISHGSYPGMVYRDPRLRGFPYHEDPEQPAFGSSWSGLAAVLGRRVAAEPWRHASWYLCEKPIWLWGFDLVQGRGTTVYEVANSPYERHPVMAATQAAMRWTHVPLMLLAALAMVGAVRGRLGGDRGAVCGLVVLVATLAYVPVIPDPRYLQPVRPVLFVLGAAGAAVAIACLRQRLRPRVASASASAEAVSGAAVAVAATARTAAEAPPRV